MRLTATFIALFALALAGCDVEPQFKRDNRSLLGELDGPKTGTVQDTLRSQADNAVKDGNYKAAAQLYKQILDRDKDNTEIALLLADNQRRTGDFHSAQLVLDKVLEKNPNNVQALESKGLAQMAGGEFAEASKQFLAVMNQAPKRWRTLNAVGILFAMKGEVPDSMAYYEAALTQSPDNVSVLNNLGLTLAMDKQYDRAIETLLNARLHTNIAAEQRNIDLNAALIYAIAGKLDDAERMATPHLSKAALYNNMGFYAYLAKNQNLAMSYLNMALTQNPTYYERAWKNMGLVTGSPGTADAHSSDDPYKEQARANVARATNYINQTDPSLKALASLAAAGKLQQAAEPVMSAPVERIMLNEPQPATAPEIPSVSTETSAIAEKMEAATPESSMAPPEPAQAERIPAMIQEVALPAPPEQQTTANEPEVVDKAAAETKEDGIEEAASKSVVRKKKPKENKPVVLKEPANMEMSPSVQALVEGSIAAPKETEVDAVPQTENKPIDLNAVPQIELNPPLSATSE